MGQTEHYTRRVNIEKLLSNGVIQEDIQNFQESYAEQEFFQAINVLKNIMRENDLFWQENGGYLDVCGSKLATGKREEIFNVIPFMGERGTGKTSTMLSFANMLAEFNPEDKKYDAFLLKRGNSSRRKHENTKFVVLQYIDVGVLKSKEDIMAIILARMLKYVNKTLDDHSLGYGSPIVRQEELRQLYQDFEQVYSDLLNLAQEGQEPEGESVLRRLQNLNSSYSLAEKFQGLVYKFLDFLSRNNRDRIPCRYYLIIALDDIDLFETINRAQDHSCRQVQRKDAYTICGQIYEYLQIPGVVVLTTYDENRLLSICAKHINETFPYLAKQECMSQAVQYIQKLILPRYKIYMPNLGYSDYPENRQLNVVISSERNLVRVLFPDMDSDSVEAGKNIELPLKKLILQYIAAVYGNYFDMRGEKQHFFEEKNLRRFKNLLLALRTWDGIKFKDADETLREQRYMHLLSYLYNQFIGEKLAGTEEATLLRAWLNMPLKRRSQEIFDYIRSERAKLDHSSPFFFQADGNERAYSYGELIQNLYIASRCGIFSKEMIHCILASYSMVLPRLYEISRSLSDTGAPMGSQYTLRSVLGTSVAGQWSNEILYTSFWYENPVKLKNSGLRSRMRATVESRIGSVSTNQLHQAFKIKIEDKSIFNTLFYEDASETQKEGFEEFLNILEILGLFFTNIRNTRRETQREPKNAEYKFEVSFLGKDTNAQQNTTEISMDGSNIAESRDVYLKAGSRYACFNILNFVVNSFTWEEYFNPLHGDFIKAIEDWLRPVQTTIPKSERLVRLREYSLINDFRKWARDYGNCAIPFQHFDMTYNILKRQGDASDHGLPERENLSEFCTCCWQVYQNISDALGQQDDDYNKTTEFQKAFTQNPFYKAFMAMENGQNDKLLFVLTELAKALVSESFARHRDDEIL